MNPVRTTDGTFVTEGAVTDGGLVARLWRWPTQFLPDAIAASPLLPVAVAVVPFAFWLLLGWAGWRALRSPK